MVRVGVFGATGAVGRELIKVLHDRKFPITKLRLFASERSAGNTLDAIFGKIKIEDANNVDFSGIDLAFFAISGDWSKANAKKAVEAGCTVIDNSSAFRYDDDVPLIIPEINSSSIGKAKLIANPNCTTAIATIPLFQIYKKYGLKKIIMSTYQAASGAGNGGMEELIEQTKQNINGTKMENKIFQYPLAFNLIPHIDSFQENAYTREEMKVAWETRKIFGNDKIDISCTAVRVPTLRVHAETIIVETDKNVDIDELKKLLSNTKGIILKDDVNNKVYPMPMSATGKYDVEVGRIRRSLVFGDKGVEFFVAGDQLLRGAALNAVEIAESIRWKK